MRCRRCASASIGTCARSAVARRSRAPAAASAPCASRPRASSVNYRHAYHAGNFADVMKHVLLTRILVHLARKEAPFRVVDTHAGIGLYDLEAEAAGKTAEWRAGVARLDEPFAPEVQDLLAPYRAAPDGGRRRPRGGGDHGGPGTARAAPGRP